MEGEMDTNSDLLDIEEKIKRRDQKRTKPGRGWD